jgi:GTP pyrophosphokinase
MSGGSPVAKNVSEEPLAAKPPDSTAREIMPREQFLGAVGLLSPYVDQEFVGRAYDFSLEAHEGQKRLSGDAYFTHCIAVALSLAEWHQDTLTISAGLLHDVVEDTTIGTEDLEREFGPELLLIVDGVTKITTSFAFTSSEAKQAETFRKMLISMAQDIRVIVVKFADRLHNMQTLDHKERAKQKRIACETREIYAPLAHRLGMAKVKRTLEDLAMKFLEPESYELISKKISTKWEKREAIIDQVRQPLVARLKQEGIEATVFGRPKHFYSIYRKMKLRDKPFEEIYDLYAIRVITETVADCYAILGIVHEFWQPLHERIKDYIATPKSNQYQSLHTTVVGPTGDRVEIQIRTENMDQTAEEGIAAHWLYKEHRQHSTDDDRFAWLRQTLEAQRGVKDPHEFMDLLKIDLFQDECFVLTPQGDLKRLPTGSTAIDFAFAIHTEVGMRCAGAKINGRFSPLSTPLQSGDLVEIVTAPTQRPSQDWLDKVRTGRAKAKIRQYLRQSTRDMSILMGRQLLEREAKKRRVQLKSKRSFQEQMSSLGFGSPEALYLAIAEGEISCAHVLNQIAPSRPRSRTSPRRVLENLIDRTRPVRGLRIENVDDVMMHLAECCQPVPGDRVFGYITRGRGLTIHRVECPNSLALSESERRVEVEWAVGEEERFLVEVKVVALDRPGLLTDLTQVTSKLGINLRSATVSAVDGEGHGAFLMEIPSGAQLKRVLRDMGRVRGVISVQRRSAGLEERDRSPGR